MSTSNPITCVSLMAHEDHVTVFVHRENSVRSFGVSKNHGKPDKVIRFYRMVFIHAEFLKGSYLQITGRLSPTKW